jgi:hypothetical protein
MQREGVLERVERRLARRAVGGAAGFMADVVTDAGRAHAEHGVRIEIGIAVDENVRDQRIVARHRHHEMDVGGAHVGAARRAHHAADRPVHGDRIGLRHHGPETEPAVLIGLEHGAQTRIVRVPAGPLHVIEAFGVGLPDVDRRARDRLAGRRGDARRHVARLALGVVGDVGARRQPRRVGDVERPEHGLLGHALRPAVVLRHHELRHAERVGEKDELLALAVAGVAGAGEELDAGEPLGLGETDVAREGMEMPDQARHDLLQARVGRVGKPAHRLLGDVGLIEVAHGCLRRTIHGP